MKTDKAIEEIRKVRHEISKEFEHDTKKLIDHYKDFELKYKKRLYKSKKHSLRTSK